MSETEAGGGSASPHLSVMEGAGFYNRQSQRSAAASGIAIPLLEQAAHLIDPGPDDLPVVIADYGSSQGRNSLRPMRAAIAVLRGRFGSERPICVTHTDLPGNDFSTLFQTLQSDPESYLQDEPNVFPSAVGRSFYENVLPPAQVSLGWSSYAAMWLSRIPAYIPGHFWEQRAVGDARAAFDAQAVKDWRTFLSLRARELRLSGRLVIMLPAIDETGIHGVEPMYDTANDCLAELVAAGTLSPAERARMVVPSRFRSRSRLLEPFAETGLFAGLTVEHCEVFRVPEAAWAAYQQHGDAQLLANQRAGFFRSVFMPTLATALDPVRSQSDRSAFADALEATLARRLAIEPVEIPGRLPPWWSRGSRAERYQHRR